LISKCVPVNIKCRPPQYLKSLNLKDSRFKIVQEGQPNGSNFFGRREKTSRRGMTVYIHFSPKQKKKARNQEPVSEAMAIYAAGITYTRLIE
jgi:hypothetical protein